MAAKRKKRVPAKRKRRLRRSAPAEFARRIDDLLHDMCFEFRNAEDNAGFASVTTVVAGAFVWAMRHGCPPRALLEIMSVSLKSALKSAHLPIECMIEQRERVDPKMVN